MTGVKREPSSLVHTATSTGASVLMPMIVQGAHHLQPGQHPVVAVELAARGLRVDVAAGDDRRQCVVLARAGARRCCRHASTLTVQPASLHQRMNRSRAWPSSSVSASRRTPPLSVAPIFASSISESHRRCWLMEMFMAIHLLSKPPPLQGEGWSGGGCGSRSDPSPPGLPLGEGGTKIVASQLAAIVASQLAAVQRRICSVRTERSTSAQAAVTSATRVLQNASSERRTRAWSIPRVMKTMRERVSALGHRGRC